jgi:hypothetical protein
MRVMSWNVSLRKECEVVTATITGAVEPGRPIGGGDCMKFHAVVTFVTGVSIPLDRVSGIVP